MNKSNILNILFIFGILSTSVFIVLFMVYLSQNCTFWGDDAYFSQYELYEDLFSCMNFNFIHGGGYIGLLLCKFFSFKLPLMLGLHPNDFITSGCGYIRGIFTVLIFLIITSFSIIHIRSKLLFFLIFLLVTGYSYTCEINSNIIYINYNWWRYFFSLLFVSIFLSFIYKNTINYQQKINWGKLIFVSLCAFIIGTSIEISFFACAFFVFLIFLFQKLLKIKLNINFYVPSAFLMLAIFLFTSTSKFKLVASQRGLAQINLTWDTLNEFSSLYFKVCISEQWYYWIVFFSLFTICILIAKKKQELNKIILPLLWNFSIMTIMFSLVLCGKTFDGFATNEFYLKHLNIICLFKILILFPLLIYISYIYKNLYNKTKLKYLLLCLIFCTTLVNGIKTYNIKYYITNTSQYKVFKEYAYILHKISRFYYLQNKTAELPASIIDKHYTTYINEYQHNYIITNSMSLIYKKPRLRRLKYIITDDAIEKYYKNGGNFSQYELENIKFSRLLDDNFILNKKYNENDIENKIKNIKNNQKILENYFSSKNL